MKILIIAHYFPPENNMAMIATLRPLSWAKYWSKAGHDVCVLTTAKTENKNLQSQLSSDISGSIRIEGVKYLLSRPETTIKSQTKTKNKRFSLYPFLRKILINTRKFIGAGSLFYGSDLWIFPTIQKGLAIYQEWQFDIVVSTFGPPASHVVASALKKKLNIFWIADYRDLWHDHHFSRARFPFSLIEKNLENTTVKNADLMTTVSIPLAEKLRKRFNKPVYTIANGFEYPATSQNLSNLPSSSQKVKIVYTGNLYLQRQNIQPLFQAIKLLVQEDPHIQDKLEISFYGWDTGNLDEIINKYCLVNMISIKGFVPREIAISLQRNADALIFLDWNDQNEQGILTGKIFEYMFSGTPILGIGASLETAAGRLIQESGTGVLLGESVEAIASAIKKLINGESLEYSPRQEVLQQYTREALANKMLEEIIVNYTNYINSKS
jgi:glycosyltransferase involved in cell wall biosynthesis